MEKNIVLNDKTTAAEKKEIVFMGHITTEGISPDPAKVEAIQNLPIPTDVTAFRRLCGTVQYLSHHMEPLRALTRKNVVFDWSKEYQNAPRL